MHFVPRDVCDCRQGINGEINSAGACAQGQKVVVEDVLQVPGCGSLDERLQRGPPLGSGKPLKPGERGALLQHGGHHGLGIFGILERGPDQRVLQIVPTHGIMRQQCGTEGPFVDFGRYKQLIAGSGNRQGCAGAMYARHRVRQAPPQALPSARDATPPLIEQQIIGHIRSHLEHRAGGGEEQVGAGETPGIFEGKNSAGPPGNVAPSSTAAMSYGVKRDFTGWSLNLLPRGPAVHRARLGSIPRG